MTREEEEEEECRDRKLCQFPITDPTLPHQQRAPPSTINRIDLLLLPHPPLPLLEQNQLPL